MTTETPPPQPPVTAGPDGRGGATTAAPTRAARAVAGLDGPAKGRLLRGLATLFWALPLTVILGVQTAETNLLGSFGFWPALGATGLLLFAVHQLSACQPGDPRWQAAVERARLLAVLLTGLAPFLHWYRLVPRHEHYQYAMLAAAVAGLLFTANLGGLLVRLTALLNRPALHDEARLFLGINLPLLVGEMLLLLGWATLIRSRLGPAALAVAAPYLPRLGFAALLLIVLPIALTMTLIWKVKQAILDEAFAPHATNEPGPTAETAGQ